MKTYYAVIDTNVLVSSLISKESVPGEIIKYVKEEVIIPLVGEDIIKEYYDVLFRNKFPFKINEVDELLTLFKDKGITLDRTKTTELFKDKDDVVFYEIVLTGRETYGEAFLVTGNIIDFPVRHYVVNPRTMKEIIEKDKSNSK